MSVRFKRIIQTIFLSILTGKFVVSIEKTQANVAFSILTVNFAVSINNNGKVYRFYQYTRSCLNKRPHKHNKKSLRSGSFVLFFSGFHSLALNSKFVIKKSSWLKLKKNFAFILLNLKKSGFLFATIR